MFGEFLRRMRAWRDRETEAGDLREEMELHRELRARKLQQEGLAAAEARYAASRRYSPKFALSR